MSGYCKAGRIGEEVIDNSAWIPNRSDAWSAWPLQLARALDAEVMVEALGSAGYTSPAEQLLDTLNLQAGDSVIKMASIMDQLNGLPHAGRWSYRASKWTPDVVLVVLGGNDVNEGLPDPNYPSLVFISAVVDLLNKIATNYGHAVQKPKIIAACGNSGMRGGLDGTCLEMKKAVAQFNEQTNTSGFVAYFKKVSEAAWYKANTGVSTAVDDDAVFEKMVGRSETYNGCGRHYNFAGDALVMHDFLPWVRQVLGWGG